MDEPVRKLKTTITQSLIALMTVLAIVGTLFCSNALAAETPDSTTVQPETTPESAGVMKFGLLAAAVALHQAGLQLGNRQQQRDERVVAVRPDPVALGAAGPIAPTVAGGVGRAAAGQGPERDGSGQDHGRRRPHAPPRPHALDATRTGGRRRTRRDRSRRGPRRSRPGPPASRGCRARSGWRTRCRPWPSRRAW